MVQPNGFALGVRGVFGESSVYTHKTLYEDTNVFAKPKKMSAKQAINLRFALRRPPADAKRVLPRRCAAHRKHLVWVSADKLSPKLFKGNEPFCPTELIVTENKKPELSN